MSTATYRIDFEEIKRNVTIDKVVSFLGLGGWGLSR